ncbi:MAG: hypothetical protein IOD00_16995 [Rhodobacter sp.]|nr:hypothetical protein [Rhodobacter sp.]MCA3482295.1 hypothetical protein [Rhodobacter sp.]
MVNLVETGQTPEQWSAALLAKGIRLSPRTLRQTARKYGTYYAMGRTMLLLGEHIEAMLKAEAQRDAAERSKISAEGQSAD